MFGAKSSACSEREFLKGDEIAWYADGDKIVRNEYNPATAYGFGTISSICIFEFELMLVRLWLSVRIEMFFWVKASAMFEFSCL